MHKMISKWCNYEGRGRKTNLDWMVRKNFIEDKKKKKSYSFTYVSSETSQVQYEAPETGNFAVTTSHIIYKRLKNIKLQSLCSL